MYKFIHSLSNINLLKTGILAGLAGILSAAAEALGGWDSTLQVLCGFMAADYVTGVLLAAVFHKSDKTKGGALSSMAGFRGLVKKSAILLLVLLSQLLDQATGSGYIRGAVCCFFIANEGLSILENLGLMGVPYPGFLKNMLEALKDKSQGGETR